MMADVGQSSPDHKKRNLFAMGSYPLQPVRIVGHLLNGILRVAPQTNAPKLARPRSEIRGLETRVG